jgi:hypothetical protein
MNDLLTSEGAMHYIGVKTTTFARLVRAGTLTSQDQGFRREDLDAYLDSLVLRRFRPDPALDWYEQRMEQYVAVLARSERPESEEQRQRLRSQWYEMGEDAVLAAMRALRQNKGIKLWINAHQETHDTPSPLVQAAREERAAAERVKAAIQAPGPVVGLWGEE